MCIVFLHLTALCFGTDIQISAIHEINFLLFVIQTMHPHKWIGVLCICLIHVVLHVTPESQGGASDVLNCGNGCCECSGYQATCYSFGDGTPYVPELPFYIKWLHIIANWKVQGTLHDDFFANVTNLFGLLTINIERLNITTIPPRTLRFFNTLELWRMDCGAENGVRVDISAVANILSIPTLTTLEVRRCGVDVIPQGAFSFLHSPSIETLSLVQNRLDSLNLTEFVALHFLKYLYVEKNRISDRITLSKPLNIKSLSLSSDGLTKFPNTCSSGGKSLFPNLEELMLHHNYIFSIEGDVCLPNLRNLDLTGNSLYFYVPGSIGGKRFPQLQKLELLYSIPMSEISSNAFENPSLTKLYIWNSQTDFSNRFLVASDIFYNCPNLKLLALGGCNFRNMGDDRFLELFGRLQLTSLIIRDCQLNYVSWRMLSNFTDLVELDLSGNRIRNVAEGAFDLFKHLKRLDLSDNEITFVGEKTFGESTRNRLKYLSLGKNPFLCTCALLWFKVWFVSNTSPLKSSAFIHVTGPLPRGINLYTCHNIPNTMLGDFSMPEQACLLDKAESILIILLCTLIILPLTATTLVFRYRWHLRLLLYEAFRDRGDVRRQRLLQNNFAFDVFLSYDSEDQEWVYKRLMPELEGRLGLKLCIHERDFIPGHNIVDNIADCVESSKKILMVFSNHFVLSQWCQFELNYCLRHVMDHDDVLIIVCVDDVASREMTTAMMAVLKTTTYIQWAELDDAVDAFWGRLHLALNEVILQQRP